VGIGLKVGVTAGMESSTQKLAMAESISEQGMPVELTVTLEQYLILAFKIWVQSTDPVGPVT